MSAFNRLKQYFFEKKRKKFLAEEESLLTYMETQSTLAFSKNKLNNFSDELYRSLDTIYFEHANSDISVAEYIKEHSAYNCHNCAIVLAVALGLSNPKLQSKIKVCRGNLDNMKYRWNGNTEHSWVEVTDKNECNVYDTSWHKVINKDAYNKIFNPTNVKTTNYENLPTSFKERIYKDENIYKM